MTVYRSTGLRYRHAGPGGEGRGRRWWCRRGRGAVWGGGGGEGSGGGGRGVVRADTDRRLPAATTAAPGPRHDDVIGVVTDVSLPGSVEQLRDATLERFGSVHLVCNNAGIPS